MRHVVTAVALMLLGALVPASAATREIFRYRAIEMHAEWGRAPTATPPPGFAGEVFAHASIDAGRLEQVEYGERTAGPFLYYNAQTYTYDAGGSLVYLITTTGVNDEEDPLHVRIARTIARGDLAGMAHVTACVRQPDASYECSDGQASVQGSWEANGVDNVRTRLHRVVRDDAAQTTTTIDSHSHTRTADASATVDGASLGPATTSSLDRQFLDTIVVCYAACPEDRAQAAAAGM